MKTTEENAVQLDALGTYVEQAGLTGKNVILFGDVPALSAYLQMPFVMSPWPDLPSYSNQIFETELDKVLENIDESRPILIFGAEFYDFLTNWSEDSKDKVAFVEKYGFKLSLLRDMIEENNYKCTFDNKAFAIFE